MSHHPRWLLPGMLALCICLFALSGVALAYSSADTAADAPSSPWTSLPIRNVSNLVVAPSNPRVLYACVTSGGGSRLLRSTDLGGHWLTIAKQAKLGDRCDIAVDTKDSGIVYAVGNPQKGGQTGTTLWSTKDGGKTWQSILPKIQGHATTSWHARHLSSAATVLFAVESISSTNRLITSADGGKTWSVLDSQFTTRGERDYAVGPQDASVLYELVGLPGQPGALYKTADGAKTWKRVLKPLPQGTHVKLASATPETVVVAVLQTNSIQLQVSMDGGSHWSVAPRAQNATVLQDWHVSPDGTVYVSALTRLPATPAPTDPGTTPTSTEGSNGDNMSLVPTPTLGIDGNPCDLVPIICTPIPTIPTADFQRVIEAFDPGAGTWKYVVQAPYPQGMLLLVSSANVNTVLWFQEAGTMALSRDIL